jgi:glycosyltransferase involved in cell wall biosynthesis
MRILQLINSLEIGGAETQLLNLAAGDKPTNDEWYYAFLHGTNVRIPPQLSKQFHDFSNHSRFSMLGIFRLALFIRRNKIDVLHAHLVQAGLLALILSKILSIQAMIYTYHNTQTLKEESKLYLLFRKLLKHFNKVICVSEEVADTIVKFGVPKKNIIVLYNSIHPDFFRQNNPIVDKRLSLITVSRLTAIKNVGVIIAALGMLRDSYPNTNWSFTIIGDGPERQDLEAQAKELKIDKHIKFTGYQNRQEIIKHHKQSTIYISASQFEGFNMALIEAMLCGIVPITTNTGIAKSIIEDGKKRDHCPKE